MDERTNPWNDLPPAPPEPPSTGDGAADDADLAQVEEPTEIITSMADPIADDVDDTAVMAAPPVREDPPILEPFAWPPPPPASAADTTAGATTPTGIGPGDPHGVAPASAPPAPRTVPSATDPASRARSDAPSERRGPGGWLTAAIGGLSGAALTLGVLAVTGNLGENEPVEAAQAAPPGTVVERVIERSTVVQGEDSPDRVANVASAAVPSIVTVQIFDVADQPQSQAGSGSGVIFDAGGLVLTNNHVIEGASQIKVSLSNGDTYEATLVGTDPRTDIAVLSVDAENLPITPFADVGSVAIGDLAIAVGNPLGLEGGPSVTAGVVSAFDRQLVVDPLTRDTLWGLLQTDAPITRGSSGGALLNDQAELIGITTAIGLSDVGAEGLGFAVPVDLVESIAEDLIAGGEVRHAFLGITGQAAFDVTTNGVEVPLGAEITDLTAGSAIGAAGARIGDIITALDGEQVNSMNLLIAELLRYRADQEVTVTVLRDGETVEIPLVLDLRTDN